MPYLPSSIWLGDEPIANVSPELPLPLSLFYFSIETLATVGYGDMHPQTNYGHIVATIEIFTGMCFLAVMTGLIFARFSRPRARFIFARHPDRRPPSGPADADDPRRQCAAQHDLAGHRAAMAAAHGKSQRGRTAAPLLRTEARSQRASDVRAELDDLSCHRQDQSALRRDRGRSRRDRRRAGAQLSAASTTVPRSICMRGASMRTAISAGTTATGTSPAIRADGRLLLDYSLFHEVTPEKA